MNPFCEEVNSEKIRQNIQRSKNINSIENKLTRFQIYPETELACKYNIPLYRVSTGKVSTLKVFEINTGKLIIIPNLLHHVPKNDKNSYIAVTFLKNAGRTGGKFQPQDKSSTRLQEISLMNNTYFGAIHYDIHLDMKLDYTISRVFQEMSLSELETLHRLCELEKTKILQSLALEVLKLPYAGYLQSGNRTYFLTTKEIYYGITHVRKIVTIICI